MKKYSEPFAWQQPWFYPAPFEHYREGPRWIGNAMCAFAGCDDCGWAVAGGDSKKLIADHAETCPGVRDNPYRTPLERMRKREAWMAVSSTEPLHFNSLAAIRGEGGYTLDVAPRPSFFDEMVASLERLR
jgi:hypothetical protein